MGHFIWTQWDDLEMPDGVTRLSPANCPLESGDLSEITFYMAPYMGGRKALEYTHSMPRLKYLQVPNAGFDDALEFLRPGMILCNARGVHDASTAELAVALAISARRGFYDFSIAQQQEIWAAKRYSSFNDSHIGILGAGSIARTLGKYISPYDVKVTYFSRSGGENVVSISNFDDYLPSLDILFIVIPLNSDSKGFMDSRRLSMMKQGAVLVNVGRGPIVDTDALVEALNSGHISAGIDVTDPEPLPAGHPLWKAKNLVLSPHVGGNSTAFERRGRALAQAQINLLGEGKDLLNIVARG